MIKLKNIAPIALIALSLLVLNACSSTARSGYQGQSQGSGGVTTSGLGENLPVQPMGASSRTLLSAPHNQSYYFDFNQSKIRNDYLASIDAQANYLVQHPQARVLLTGNTDARGSHEYNIALGERRAMAVKDRLLMNGVNKNQLRVISYGDMRPIAFGHDEHAFAKNRRVDLIYKVK